MMWQVRALLEDRPGALAAMAVRCGERSVNILGLQIFPAADGRVVDELVLHTPGGWTATDVEQLCVLAGLTAPSVAPCSPHALEDQPVRYLRAARVVAAEPERLPEQLGRLLDAVPSESLPGAHPLALHVDHGPEVHLSRDVPFTDTEVARASELRGLAAAAALVDADVAAPPDGGCDVVLRPGTSADVAALVAMHERCSAETVCRRYHAPMPRVSVRLARALLQPSCGLSLVATCGADIVAVGMLAADPSDQDVEPGTAEVGLMVEDRRQCQGLGARLLRALAAEARGRGVAALTCTAQSGNEAVLRTIRRAGLRARISYDGGVTKYRIPVGSAVEAQAWGPSSSGRSSAWSTTSDVTARVRQT